MSGTLTATPHFSHYHMNHPIPLVCGETIIHEIGPWCQKGWGPLISNMHRSNAISIKIPMVFFREIEETILNTPSHPSRLSERKEVLLGSPSFWCLSAFLMFLACQGITVVSASIITWPASSSCLCLLLFLEGHQSFWIKGPPWSHMTSLSLMTSATNP